MVNSMSDQGNDVQERTTAFGGVDKVRTLVWMRAVRGLVGL
jgi:hypothetical protein